MAVRRAAAPPPPAAGGSVNFGDDNFYQGGLGLPEGDYALAFNTQMFQPTKQNGQPVGAPFLSVMMTAYPIDGNGNLTGEPSEHPLSCGQKAHQSFVPSADGKGFDSVPGGPAVGMNDMTNWSIFRKSLRDCGLPEGVLANDLTVLDGLWAHTRNIPEPEGRKELRSATGEAALLAAVLAAGQPGQAQQAQAQQARSRTIPVVTEIKANGKPWEGTGGIPGETAPAGGPAPRALARPAVAARGRVAPPVAAAPAGNGHATDVTEEDIMNIALEGVTDFLVKPANANGCTKVALRGGMFTEVQKKQGDEMATAVVETVFATEETLNAVLNQLGYRTFGPRVMLQPAQA